MARLAVVLGDPSGIGPEVVAKALYGSPPGDALLIGDEETWRQAQRVAGVELPAIPAARPARITRRGVAMQDLTPGVAGAGWLEQAVRLALRGVVDAVVFAPLNKQALLRAGYGVRDEYDLCAAVASVRECSAMNVIPHPAGEGLLWVARVSSHIPFREIHSCLATEGILKTIRSAHRAAASCQTQVPRIGVAALNPHGGEGGLLGDEEIRVIQPAIETASSEGIQVSGPYPADQVFRMARHGTFQVVISMYHDQAQIATKLLAFHQGVTVGVGFPFALTTPSHGTAFDIAGKGVADPGAMIQALVLAERLAERD